MRSEVPHWREERQGALGPRAEGPGEEAQEPAPPRAPPGTSRSDSLTLSNLTADSMGKAKRPRPRPGFSLKTESFHHLQKRSPQ